MVTNTKAISALKSKLEKSSVGNGGTVPAGRLQHFDAKAIGNGSTAVIGLFRPNAKAYKGKVPTSGYSARFVENCLSPIGVSPWASPYHDANRLQGFEGGGWQYATQMACRYGAARGVQAVSWGLYAIADNGSTALVAVGVANTTDLGTIHASALANRLFGASFDVPTDGDTGPSNVSKC